MRAGLWAGPGLSRRSLLGPAARAGEGEATGASRWAVGGRRERGRSRRGPRPGGVPRPFPLRGSGRAGRSPLPPCCRLLAGTARWARWKDTRCPACAGCASPRLLRAPRAVGSRGLGLPMPAARRCASSSVCQALLLASSASSYTSEGIEARLERVESLGTGAGSCVAMQFVLLMVWSCSRCGCFLGWHPLFCSVCSDVACNLTISNPWSLTAFVKVTKRYW